MIKNVILVGVSLRRDTSYGADDLNELEQLCHTAGFVPCARVHQRLHKYVPATLMGSGCVQHIYNLILEHKAGAVVLDHELTGSQIRNLEKAWQRPLMTRSQLILNIFAQRARSHEGKLQVELAQLLDDLPRQVGGWHGSLSRLAGGIGTRGPGEAALEIDRRRIREKIKNIERKLKNVRAHRYRVRKNRSHLPSLALIGYTSSGKSTLLNKLTGAQVLSHDKLFSTLDPTTRKIYLPHASTSQPLEACLTDTVGFIRRLPTHLIEAFKATLEESEQADILLHVIDASHPLCHQQAQVVQQLIHSLKWEAKPCLLVLNKCDKWSHFNSTLKLTNYPVDFQIFLQQQPYVFISAYTGQGLDQLKQKCLEHVQQLNHNVELYFPHQDQEKLYELERSTSITKLEAHSRGTYCHARLTLQQIQKWKKFLASAS